MPEKQGMDCHWSVVSELRFWVLQHYVATIGTATSVIIIMTMIMMMMIPSFLWRYSPNRPLASSFEVYKSHTIRHTVGLLWTSVQPIAEACTYTGQHKRQTSMPREGFEPAIPATKRPQTYALDRAATGIALIMMMVIKTLCDLKFLIIIDVAKTVDRKLSCI
jgi:hypothetical protein